MADSIYFSQGNIRDELHLVERMFEEIVCELAIEDKNVLILDRLLHYSVTFNINGNFYRLKEKKKIRIYPATMEKNRPVLTIRKT